MLKGCTWRLSVMRSVCSGRVEWCVCWVEEPAMTSPLSVDLSERAVSAVMAGASCPQAGERFGISAASVSSWHARHLRDGHVRSEPMDRTSSRPTRCVSWVYARSRATSCWRSCAANCCGSERFLALTEEPRAHARAIGRVGTADRCLPPER